MATAMASVFGGEPLGGSFASAGVMQLGLSGFGGPGSSNGFPQQACPNSGDGYSGIGQSAFNSSNGMGNMMEMMELGLLIGLLIGLLEGLMHHGHGGASPLGGGLPGMPMAGTGMPFAGGGLPSGGGMPFAGGAPGGGFGREGSARIGHGGSGGSGAGSGSGSAGSGSGASAAPSGPITNDANLGPTTNPVPGATGSRLDQGLDGTTQKFVSPFNGKVVYSSANDSGWKGGGYVAIQSDKDPNNVFYAAEGLTPTVQVGQHVSAGQQIATPRPNPYNGINGNFEIGRANPKSPGQPLAQVVSNPQQEVMDFYNWIKSLGGPTATSTSDAGHA